MNTTTSQLVRNFGHIVPKSRLKRLLWLSDEARSMGIHLQAGKGSGKSRLMGRIIAWLDFVSGIPLLIFDPHGPTIDNFLDKLIRLPREIQEHFGSRILYVDMSGKSGRVIPFPLYYRLGNESLYEISQRFLDVIRKIDPFLQTASVEGWNPLWRTGTYVGMLLAALNFQITEAENLLRNPLGWSIRINQALDAHPDLQQAAAYFQILGDAKDNVRERNTSSFINKIAFFGLDPSMQAIFGANAPGIDWNEVVEQGLAVLIDFRHEHDIERRRFKMMWSFSYFLDFVKHRGAGRHRPISLIVDELTSLFSVQSLAADLFVSDIDELINVIARNYSIWLCIAHQELFQFSERLQKTLMTMGTQMLGVTSDPDASLSLARQFFRYDPYWVKKYEPIYGSLFGIPELIDRTSVEFTIEEQLLLQSYNFSDQGRFQFLVRPAPGEGGMTGKLYPVSIERFDIDQYPDDELVALARDFLMLRNGRRVDEVLNEVELRLGTQSGVLRPYTPQSEGTIDLDVEIPLWGE